MLVDIDKIKVSDRIRKDFGNIQELADDIKENGLINPPVVTPDFTLIAGERRLKACKLLGYKQIEVRIMTVKDYEHQLRLEISENENRKEFTFSERVEWARRLEQIEKLKAKERMKNPVQNFAEGETGKARDKVAERAGFGSGENYRKAKFIADNADPDIIQKLDQEKISIHKAYQETKARLEAAEKAAQKAREEAQAERERANKLEKQLAEMQNREPEVIEKVVEKEVIPEDYYDLKKQLEAKIQENKQIKEQLEQKSEELFHLTREQIEAKDRHKLKTTIRQLMADLGKYTNKITLEFKQLSPSDKEAVSEIKSCAFVLRRAANELESLIHEKEIDISGTTIDVS